MFLMKKLYPLSFIAILWMLSTPTPCAEMMKKQDLTGEVIWSVLTQPTDEELTKIINEELGKANHEKGTKTTLHAESVETQCTLMSGRGLSTHIIIEDKNQNNVGYIDLSMSATVRPYLKSEPGIQEIQKKKIPYSAGLTQIGINQDYQGKGYSGDALKIFHHFLDTIGVDYTSLGIDSKMPYTGSIYKKAGYNFTKDTLDCIKIWGESNQIAANEAETKYLENTAIPLKNQNNEGCVPWMIRYKK